MAKGTFTDTDKGATRVLKGATAHPVIDVGVIGPKAEKSVKGVTIREIAGFNEFGTKERGGHTPARPFIGSWFDLKKDEMRGFITKASGLLLLGKLKPQQFIRLVGEKAVGDIKKHMTTGIKPRNADSTVARKKSTKTLIDTGAMRSSVSYREVKYK